MKTMLIITVVSLASIAGAQTQRDVQALTKIAQAKAYCEAYTNVVDKKMVDDNRKYAHLLHSNPNVLQLALKQNAETHDMRYRECFSKQIAGRKQWQ